MNFLSDVVRWFGDGAHWRGTGGVPHRVFEHLQLSGLTIVLAVLLAVPLGVVLGHQRRGELMAVAMANLGRSIPSFAILALALPFSIRFGLGLGFWPTFAAVFLLAIPPIFINTFTAIRGVDTGVLEAAKGMGMEGGQLLWQVEMPLAMPVILAGVRVAAVQVIATATLGALAAWGGLGRFVVDGLAQRDFVQMFAGATLVASLAILTDAAFTLAERLLAPTGVNRPDLTPNRDNMAAAEHGY